MYLGFKSGPIGWEVLQWDEKSQPQTGLNKLQTSSKPL
jgi:hypothetical protein